MDRVRVKCVSINRLQLIFFNKALTAFEVLKTETYSTTKYYSAINLEKAEIQFSS